MTGAVKLRPGETGVWLIYERQPESRLVLDSESATLLRIEQRIRLRARCPSGHDLPAEVTAEEAIVRHFHGTLGPTVGCRQCSKNYRLPLGNWPSSFPPPQPE